MLTKIKTHRRLGASLKLFLDSLEYKSVWNLVNEDYDRLVIFGKDRLLFKIKQQVMRTGFIPYHFALAPKSKGKMVKVEDRVSFTGEITQVATFNNISGEFSLILFEDEDHNNWLFKQYRVKELPEGKVTVTGRPVCSLKGLNGENINLFNWARVKSC